MAVHPCAAREAPINQSFSGKRAILLDSAGSIDDWKASRGERYSVRICVTIRPQKLSVPRSTTQPM